MRKYTEQYALSYTGDYHRCLAVLQENDVRNAKPFKEDYKSEEDVAAYRIVCLDKTIFCTAKEYDDALDYARNYAINDLAAMLKKKGVLDGEERGLFAVDVNTETIVHREIVYIGDLIH